MTGARGTSRFRSWRQRKKAPAGSSALEMTAPDQPSSGSSASAASGRLTAFHG